MSHAHGAGSRLSGSLRLGVFEPPVSRGNDRGLAELVSPTFHQTNPCARRAGPKFRVADIWALASWRESPVLRGNDREPRSKSGKQKLRNEAMRSERRFKSSAYDAGSTFQVQGSKLRMPSPLTLSRPTGEGESARTRWNCETNPTFMDGRFQDLRSQIVQGTAVIDRRYRRWAGERKRRRVCISFRNPCLIRVPSVAKKSLNEAR
jgi:hypothetical protein